MTVIIDGLTAGDLPTAAASAQAATLLAGVRPAAAAAAMLEELGVRAALAQAQAFVCREAGSCWGGGGN